MTSCADLRLSEHINVSEAYKSTNLVVSGRAIRRSEKPMQKCIGFSVFARANARDRSASECVPRDAYMAGVDCRSSRRFAACEFHVRMRNG